MNVDDIKRFLGLTDYYCHFVKNYAKIAKPLTDLLSDPKKNHGKWKVWQNVPVNQPKFVWEEDQQKAFDTLKEAHTTAPILAYPDDNHPFMLHTDASADGLGAVLYQDINGVERVIAYANRSLKPSEKNYPAHKLEFLALKWSVCQIPWISLWKQISSAHR